YCRKSGLGQILRSSSLHRLTIRLKRSKNLTPTGFPSLRSVKSDRLLVLAFEPSCGSGARCSDLLGLRLVELPTAEPIKWLTGLVRDGQNANVLWLDAAMNREIPPAIGLNHN
ncbi:MAG: hypothetical protein KKC01_02450, partial [Gammaproteobacteria bacterium]|nr:hypothetical protein [Gammaproteobacteria bacterium]